MTEISQLNEFATDHPAPTVGDPAWRLNENTSQGESSVYPSRLVYAAMIDRFLVDFDEAETYQARLDIARIIMRLLQYI